MARKRATVSSRLRCYWIICYLPRPDLMSRIDPVVRAALVKQMMEMKVLSDRVGKQIIEGRLK